MSESSADSYFHDPAREAFASTHFQDQSIQPPDAINDEGLSTLDDALRPTYIIPIGPIDGVWSMIQRIKGWKHEGWLALWKGTSSTSVPDILTSEFKSLCSPVDVHHYRSYHAPPPSSCTIPTYWYLFPKCSVGVISHSTISGPYFSPYDLCHITRDHWLRSFPTRPCPDAFDCPDIPPFTPTVLRTNKCSSLYY